MSTQNPSLTPVAVVGSGPAGYSAALYASRAMLKPLLFAGPEPGGQLMYTTDVENYPGFSQGIVGPQLMDEMRKQAIRFGTKLVLESVTKLETQVRPFILTTENGQYQAESVILAMGAKSKMLGVGEEAFLGKGVSTCAVCDAAFYKEKTVFVVGGGDSAIEDATALIKHAKSVTMLVRRDQFRASKIMQQRISQHKDKLTVLWNREVLTVKGETHVTALVVKNTKTGEKEELPADGLFLAIGHDPATAFLRDSGVLLDQKEFVVTGFGMSERGVEMASSRVKDGLVRFPSMTSVEGVFAGGDAVDFRWRQAATAAGAGVAAALDSEWWLEEVHAGSV